MRIVYNMEMMNIDSGKLSFSLLENLYKDGEPGEGLQCNHNENSQEYKEIRQKCEAIYKQVKELEELL